ncbi:hypothetical protein BDY24DRAFT_399903 [Mrakia frigida]|uniref:uncharacterized protein n=1 Tax=Mrakia frigida TaxID=29902 RepID=UPI003FCC20F2
MGGNNSLSEWEMKMLDLPRTMSKELEEELESVRVEGMVGLSRLIRELSSEDESAHLHRIIHDSRFWTCLSSTSALNEDGSSLGVGRPRMRRSGWKLLGDLLSFQPDLVRSSLGTISTAVLRSCWLERDEETVEEMWDVVSSFLRAFPESWMLEHTSSRDPLDAWSSCDPDGDKPCLSWSFENLLVSLQNGMSPGRSKTGTSILVDVLQTIPRHIFPLTTQSIQSLFDALWSSYPSLLNSSLHPAPVKSLLFTIQSCNTYLLGERLTEGLNLHPNASFFADEQVERCRREAGAYVEVGSRWEAHATGGGVGMDVEEEEEFESYGYDEEDEDADEDEEDGDGMGDVEGDRLSEGSGAEERKEKSWDGGEKRWAVRGRDLAFEMENHREFIHVKSEVTSRSSF